MRSSIVLESLETRKFLSVTPTGIDTPVDLAPTDVVVPISTSAPTSHGAKLTEHAGVKFTDAKLGTFHLKVIDLALSAVVHWGDGTTSVGKIEGSYATGDWYVEGSHTYDAAGAYKTKVEIFTKPIGAPNLHTGAVLSFNSHITVKELKPSAAGRSLIEVATQKFNTKLGEFHFKTVDQLLNATINWGDGTKSDGKIVGSYATGDWYVLGKHTYAHTGTFKVDVKIFAHLAGNPNLHPSGPIAAFTSVIKVMGWA